MNWFKEKKRVMILVFFCCLLWGSAFPILKLSYADLQLTASDFNVKILFAGIRFTMASGLLFLFSKAVLKLDMRIDRKAFGMLLVLGLFNTTLLYFFFYNGLANTSGIKASILQSMNTFIVVVLSHFVYKDDRINHGKILGIIFGFLGIIIVNIEQGFGGFTFTLYGEGFMVLSGLSSGIGTLLAKRAGREMHPFKVTAWQMFIGAMILLLYGLTQAQISDLRFTPFSGALLVYLSFLSATAFGLWFMLLKFNKAGEISIYRFMIPVAGSILTALLVPGEHFNLTIVLGLLSVSAGIYFVNKTRAAVSESDEPL
jgi:drug/metabolite transporter (DMT)-like permease